ncbi:hypothetical protein BY996DRAFT_6524994 [Phakopsora pachyrhizi]|nr:hypothetical protein BY996DRAFT_6524994 [Phakopsora pachyrhizi]
MFDEMETGGIGEGEQRCITKFVQWDGLELLPQWVGKAGDRLGWAWLGWVLGKAGWVLAWLGWAGSCGKAGCKLLSDAKDLTPSSYTGYKLFSALKQ